MRYFDRFDHWDWSGPYLAPDTLPRWLVEERMQDVQSSVEHQNGDDYPTYPKEPDGYMHFGTQIVSVKDCVLTVLSAAGLREEVDVEVL